MVSLAQRRRALQAADDLLNELGLDQARPVDVFGIVDDLGLWLVFNRLDNLLGAVVPRGEGGIMISTQRGVAVQRYTAAHELGHWMLDYGEAAFDTEDEIYFPSIDRELLAQIFAGYLLMPAPLVYESCARYNIRGSDSALPTSVYQVARDMGSSFEATVRQLANLEIVDGPTRDRLLRVQPSAIKSELGHGHKPSGAVDLWPAAFSEEPEQLHVTEGDEIVVSLPENRTTGYRWLTQEDLDARPQRRPSAAPVFAAEVPRHDPEWEPQLAPRSATAIRRAIRRLPGSADATRTLRATPPESPTATEPDPDAATLENAASVVPAHVDVVDDLFHASWTTAAPSAMRTIRRAIAGLGTDGQLQVSDHPASAAGTGTRVVALKSAGEGEQTFNLFYASPYQPDAPVAEEYELRVEVQVPPAILRRRWLLKTTPGDDPDGDGEEL